MNKAISLPKYAPVIIFISKIKFLSVLVIRSQENGFGWIWKVCLGWYKQNSLWSTMANGGDKGHLKEKAVIHRWQLKAGPLGLLCKQKQQFFQK